MSISRRMMTIVVCAVAATLAASCLPTRNKPSAIAGIVLSADPRAAEVILDVGTSAGVEKGMVFVIKSISSDKRIPGARVVRVTPTRAYTTYPKALGIVIRPGDEATWTAQSGN